MEKDIRKCSTHGDFVELLQHPVLRVCPFLVPFKRRLKLFERIVTTNRIDIQGVNDANPFNTNPLRRGIPVRIARGRILEDGLATMNNLGPNMRQRIEVQYYNEAGTRESGIDAGGLFKEFWTDLCAIAFDPNYALFRVTDGAGNCMYPNPSSGAAHGSDHIVLFAFLGRILGKALYEGM
jgi:ubiquitin-protein ligase E3 C